MLSFPEQLRRQLGFIERSCQSFDAGYEDEAIRIATCIRVLVHDTKSSTSMLTHLSAKSINLLSTVTTEPVKPGTIHFDGLTRMTVDGPKPKLGMVRVSSVMPVSDWWGQVVYASKDHRLARSNLVLGAANKDGGAHVDPALTPEYETITSNFLVRAEPDGTLAPLTNVHLVGLRQLGHEILNSPELRALVP
jgi:hypothetical protein